MSGVPIVGGVRVVSGNTGLVTGMTDVLLVDCRRFRAVMRVVHGESVTVK